MKLAGVFLVLSVTAQARVTAVVHGSPVSFPVLGIVAVALVLALTAAVLWLLRSVLRDGGFWRLRPRAVST